ncbi:cyclase/dehydrase [Thioalkalivibrio nitratireducens DSM 14787]|uniref:Cyclase/dehydrase n=1 Tax=Thioalkalivibrio nitratireducens (strain DSM 14787 / UNIQEM 213 / ALEN2) TaxID=1255043 RepID=L0E1Y6_THIND|nr:cyclase/dehydrase [Thioalkalivibrio nitratireducens]AGA35220.1 cyclase/dehydrase [Thioalkalivibrio nitratireducens DSM 14787]
MLRLRWWTLSLLLVVWPMLLTGTVSDIHVAFDGARVEFRLDALVLAAAEDVRAVVHDYERLDRVFPLVAASRRLEGRDEGLERVFTLMRGCILFLCRELEHTIDIRTVQDSWSSAVTVPELSRVRRGQFSWLIEPGAGNPEHARIRIYGYFEPDFRVPRLVGAPLVRMRILSELRESVASIERAALEHAAAVR